MFSSETPRNRATPPAISMDRAPSNLFPGVDAALAASAPVDDNQSATAARSLSPPAMSFLPASQTVELAKFACDADKEARSDLAHGFLRDEDDYTSTLTGGLRRKINSCSATGLAATSYMLDRSRERQSGCDAAIILRRSGKLKVALFEAKLPRIRNQGTWDYSQTSTGLSHFSDQLERQRKLRSEFAVFGLKSPMSLADRRKLVKCVQSAHRANDHAHESCRRLLAPTYVTRSLGPSVRRILNNERLHIVDQ